MAWNRQWPWAVVDWWGRGGMGASKHTMGNHSYHAGPCENQ